MLLFFQDRLPGTNEPKVSLVLLLPGLMLRKLPGLSSALPPGQSETLILHQRAVCYDLPLRAEDRSALRNRKSKVAHSLWLRSYQRSNSPALPMAIPALPHITELPLALHSKRLLLMLKSYGSQTHIPKMMLIYLLDSEPPSPEKMRQRWPRDWLLYWCCPISAVPPGWKGAGG